MSVTDCVSVLYSSTSSFQQGRQHLKEIVTIQIVEPLVLWRASGLGKGVRGAREGRWQRKGAGLLFSPPLLATAIEIAPGLHGWTRTRRLADGPAGRETAGRWHGLFELQRHFWPPRLRVGKEEEDNFSSVTSLYTESTLAEGGLIKDT